MSSATDKRRLRGLAISGIQQSLGRTGLQNIGTAAAIYDALRARNPGALAELAECGAYSQANKDPVTRRNRPCPAPAAAGLVRELAGDRAALAPYFAAAEERRANRSPRARTSSPCQDFSGYSGCLEVANVAGGRACKQVRKEGRSQGYCSANFGQAKAAIRQPLPGRGSRVPGSATPPWQIALESQGISRGEGKRSSGGYDWQGEEEYSPYAGYSAARRSGSPRSRGGYASYYDQLAGYSSSPRSRRSSSSYGSYGGW